MTEKAKEKAEPKADINSEMKDYLLECWKHMEINFQENNIAMIKVWQLMRIAEALEAIRENGIETFPSE